MAKNYTLGRGKVFFERFVSGTLAGEGERYVGNTPEFNINIESESLDHFNSDEGVREKDDSVLLELNRAGSFITDQIDVENVALFLLGSASPVTETSAQGETETLTVKQGLFYQLGRTSARPSGVRGISSVSVSIDPNGSATVGVEGTDYRVDLDTARLEIIEGGGIADDTEIEVTYDVDATTRDQIVTAADAEIDGALRFVAYNPKGAKRDFYFPHVRLSPSGDFALKGDEWQQISFDVEVLKLDANTAAIYVDGRPTATP